MVSNTYLINSNPDKFICPGWDISQYTAHTLQSVKDVIDLAALNNYILIFMLHDVVSGTPAPLTWEINETELSDIIDYSINSGLDIVCFKDINSLFSANT